jgi:hypothetical protein
MAQTPSGDNELRSRIWITDYHRETDNTFLPMWMVNAIGNSSLYRQIYAPRYVRTHTVIQSVGRYERYLFV